MRRRLYFLLPNVSRAKNIFNHLLLARIDDNHIHFLARDGMDLKDLPEATLGQRSDLWHGVELGLFVGGLTGLFAGLFVFYYTDSMTGIGVAVVPFLSILGALFGTWSSSLISLSVPNTQLKRFRSAIDRGKILLMVDVPKERLDEIKKLMHKQNPEAKLKGTDPMMPAFP